ncbi:transcriptional activator protein acu-15 [Aspergillus udagawae]|uniref:Transcriptional activator protein acu-15 n=1 Tax=Aspergillus udagawae TaxID=91492 RepID=A0ABQ1B913_9EURO|nr:transcriptional activator protein acu-15 [Aspergillus udagawae]
MEPPSDQLSLQGPPGKRRRVALACDVCRTRKSRCDGTRPQCGMCKDLGFECVYTPPVTATNVIVQKDYLKDLESRVKSLEENLTTMRSDLSGLAAQMTRRSPPGEGRLEPCHEPLADLAGSEDPIDAMGAVTFADEEDCGYFGPSSNIAFLRHLSRAVSHRESNQNEINTPRIDQITYDGGFVSATRPPSPLSGHTPTAGRPGLVTNPTLPSSEETLQLIRRYFYDTGLLFPYIHPPTFLETYDEFKNNAKKVRRTWLGLLSIMLAMAKVTAVSGHAPAETRIKESTVYYRQALNLCRGEMLRGTTLEVVQYLLLMGQYLQGTQKSVQAWTVHGLAVKAALQLGLHSKDASQAFSPLEREIRKRTWFGCVVLDRTLSMTFGRPPAIPDSYVQLDLPVVDSVGQGQPFVDDKTIRHSIQFFNSTITLYKQMGTIIDQVYGQNLGCGPGLSVGETVGRVLSIENQLFSWVMALPESLRQLTLQGLREEIKQSEDQPRPFSLKFRVILTLRYLHTQILLHRPILVKFLDASLASGLEPGQERILNEIGYSSMNKCVESAMGVIDIIHELVSATGWQRDLLGAWWYSLYYTFNAALVIIGATWVQRTRQSAQDSPVHQPANIQLYPGRAVATLYRLDTGNRMVDRCRYYLEQLISALRLQPDDPNGTAISSATPGFNYSSFGIECGEFMLDDLFTNITHAPTLERW